MTNQDLDLGTNTIDIRDVFKRIEELAACIECCPETALEAAVTELAKLRAILADLKGYGGIGLYKGEWYPGLLIRESHFEYYARVLAEQTVGWSADETAWPNNCVDWAQAARVLKLDYTYIEIDRVAYYFR